MATSTTQTVFTSSEVSMKKTRFMEEIKVVLTDENYSKIFVDQVNSPEFSSHLSKDITLLNITVRDIQHGFRKVTTSLIEFDSMDYKDEKGCELKLVSIWQGYSRRFNTIVYDSRDHATRAAAYITRYSQVLLNHPIETTNYDDLRHEITGFLEGLDERHEQAARTRTQFDELSIDVSLFAEELELTVHRANKPVHDDLHAIKQKIRNLEDKLAEVKKTRSDIGATCISLLSKSASSTGMAILSLSPVAMLHALEYVFKAAGLGFEALSKYGEESVISLSLQACQYERKKIARESEFLEKYQHTLEITKEEIHSLADKIGVIGAIWQILKSDTLQLSEQLRDLPNPARSADSFIMEHVAIARPLFERLSQALEGCAKNVLPTERGE